MNSIVCRSNALMLRPMQQRKTIIPPFNGRSDNNGGAMGGGGGKWWRRDNVKDGRGGGGGNEDDFSFMLSSTQNIHLLRSRPTGAMMAASVLSSPTAYDRRYGLGFVNKEDAQLVRKNLCSKSRVEIIDYHQNDFSIVSVEKKIDINELPMFIHEMDIQNFLALPFKHNIRIGFVHSVLEDNHREILLEIQTIDAIEMNPFAYKSQLMMNGVYLEDLDGPDPLEDSIKLIDTTENEKRYDENELDFDYDHDFEVDAEADLQLRELYPFIVENDKRERRLDF